MDTNEISRKQVFEMLANDRRRFAVFYLIQRGPEPQKLGSIADAVAAWENDIPVEDVSSRQRKRVYDSLQQHHIPALADHGVVSYRPDRCLVELTPVGKTLGDYIDYDRGKSVRWRQLSLGLGFAGTIVAFSHIIGVLTMIPPVVSLLVLSVGIAIGSIAQFSNWPTRSRRSGRPPSVGG